VRTAPLDSGERGDVLGALAAESGIEVGQISTEAVGPKWGEQISVKALQGLIVFLVLVSIYISFRFEWKMAIGGITSLVHDLAITAGVYAWVGREVTPETVIAVLTILGYSLYDTVVIFDRIKENVAETATLAREGYGPVVNRSLNQVFMRSFNTTITTLFPITALMLFGGETLKGFAFALFVGVVLGGYSSLFVAAPLVTVLKEHEQRFAEIRDRVARREDLAAVRGEKASAPETHERRRELVTAAPRPSASTAPRRRPKKKSRSKRKKR
jgi:preprotein translocase subunit SecF